MKESEDKAFDAFLRAALEGEKRLSAGRRLWPGVARRLGRREEMDPRREWAVAAALSFALSAFLVLLTGTGLSRLKPRPQLPVPPDLEAMLR